MILKKKIYKIATILPYKESYTFDYASAVSLWVSEYFKNLNLETIIIYMEIQNLENI